MGTATEEGAVYERWFVDSLRFDGIGRSADDKRGLADLVGNYAADFEARASPDETALIVTWDLFDIDMDDAKAPLPPGGVGGPRIKEEPKDDLPSKGERIAYREAWRKLSSAAIRTVEFLERIGVILPNGPNATHEGRLLLWAYFTPRSEPVWFGTNQIPSPFEVKSGDFSALSLIARAMRYLERRLREDSLKADSADTSKKNPRRQTGPKDAVTLKLITALREGTAAGKRIEEINREFAAKHKVRPLEMKSKKRAARRNRKMWDSSADK